MHDLYKLKDMLVKELEGYAKSGNLSKTSLDTVDKLAHATKNVIKVMECCDGEEYSNAMRRSYAGMMNPVERSYRERSYDDGYSGSNDNLRGQLYKMMEMASDERTRDELRRLIDRI